MNTGLNKITRDLHSMCHAFTDINPEYKKQIDKVYGYLREVFERMIYERKKEHMNRLPFKKNIDVGSVIKSCNRLKKHSKEKDYEGILQSLVDIDVYLQITQWDIRTIRRNLRTLIDKVDLKYFDAKGNLRKKYRY